MASGRLTIVTGAQVDRLPSGDRARQRLSYRAWDTETHASREGLLTVSPYDTAKLVMVSGLGLADNLRAHGSALVAD